MIYPLLNYLSIMYNEAATTIFNTYESFSTTMHCALRSHQGQFSVKTNDATQKFGFPLILYS